MICLSYPLSERASGVSPVIFFYLRTIECIIEILVYVIHVRLVLIISFIYTRSASATFCIFATLELVLTSTFVGWSTMTHLGGAAPTIYAVCGLFYN